MYRIIFILLSLTTLSCNDKPKFNIFKEITISTDEQIYPPCRFQFNSDEELFLSFPHFYDRNEEKDKNLPLMHFNSKENKLEKLQIEADLYSVMGFTINKDDHLYILNQGKIDTNNNIVDSPGLIIKKKESEETFNFTENDIKYSVLTDIVVDHEGKYAYITDGGIMGNNKPGLIVLDLESKESYKVLKNDKSFRKKVGKEGINSDNNDGPIPKIFDNIGVNNIQISCDDETIYYSSIDSKILYSVSIKDIFDAIKKYNSSNNDDDLNKIEVKEINLDFTSYHTLISSKNNIFGINNETKDVELSLTIDGDLSNYEKDKNQKIEYEKPDTEYAPISINVNEGKLYVLITKIKEQSTRKLIIYEAELNNDEFNNNVGCTIFIFKLYGSLIFIFVLVFIILCTAIMMIIANSGQKIEISNLKKEMEKEAEIDELNRQLNE